MTVVRNADARVTETPGGVMTTLASPTLGGASRSLWRVEVKPGGQGPLHDFDVEQVWTWITGSATVSLGEETFTVAAGDTVIMPARTARQIVADAAEGYTAVVTAPGDAHAFGADGKEFGTPAWIV
ncbi:cupin domain-containing protein [Nonomuraea endophytica]|uniref:Quercetin dioxygenase-like cupin family protein n=1 Tax=Nonomuraea endophytica TaxID=714136 RepID=A0A7W8EKP8_9ACTN|nr:cupin domain-containing protein [Nonomuraea endophytica]MBB5082811.1 quercetin dioxygenase-like cupin family protein [Nonomuraea endophytica]